MAAPVLVTILSCGGNELPKPYGELRLEYPAAKYQELVSDCPFTFEYSDYAKIRKGKKDCWFYIDYPKMRAQVFLTYYPVNNDFDLHLKEAEKLVYEHTIKASAIDTKSFEYADKKVFGNFYDLKGQTASNVQFFATDSTHHFVTANLYFKTRPKPDSLAPAIDYIRKDMLRMVDTFRWKN